MRTREIIAGLQTLMPFYKDQEGYHTIAVVDEILALQTDKPLSDAALDKMIGLGWYQDYGERDNNERYSRKDYRQDECWVSYL